MISQTEATSNPSGSFNLLPHPLADLRASGLSDAQIQACGFRSVTEAREIGKLLRWKAYLGQLGPALCIPDRGPDGQFLKGYCRLKPDQPRQDAHGKPVKYESPKGKPNEPYFPPANHRGTGRSGSRTHHHGRRKEGGQG
jgi:hypothetical protein